MTEISGKSLHEIYKEDARKYKESIKLTGNFDKREALKVTIPMEEFDKLEKLALSAHTDKLSVEKLEPIGYYNEAHGFLHEEFDKDCYCQGGCSMEAVYTESQVKKLTDEKTVEKLQEHLLPYKKEMVQKIIDEKMQLVTADEFLKLHKESLTAIRENDKLQKEIDAAKKYIEESYKADKEDNKLLDLIIEAVAKLKSDNETLKKALTEIAEIIDDNIHECNYGCDNSCELNGSLDMYSVENVQSVIDSTLAAIGGDDD